MRPRRPWLLLAWSLLAVGFGAVYTVQGHHAAGPAVYGVGAAGSLLWLTWPLWRRSGRR